MTWLLRPERVPDSASWRRFLCGEIDDRARTPPERFRIAINAPFNFRPAAISSLGWHQSVHRARQKMSRLRLSAHRNCAAKISGDIALGMRRLCFEIKGAERPVGFLRRLLSGGLFGRLHYRL